MVPVCHAGFDKEALGNSCNSTAVQIANLRETVSYLQSFGTRSSRDKQWVSAYWVLSRFNSLGIECNIETYDFKGEKWPNVIATIKGRKRASEVLMIIAHADSISEYPSQAPGADDNGSGIAVLLESREF